MGNSAPQTHTFGLRGNDGERGHPGGPNEDAVVEPCREVPKDRNRGMPSDCDQIASSNQHPTRIERRCRRTRAVDASRTRRALVLILPPMCVMMQVRVLGTK